MVAREVALESDRPFFSRTRTKHALDALVSEITDSGRLLLYGGAGVTIDRSNLNWRRMVDGLLSPYVDNEQARNDIFDANSILEVASLAVEYWKKDYGDEHFRERIADRLRVMLYVPGDWQAGILATSMARVCSALSDQEAGFVLATPNYDDYLVEELQLQIGRPPRILTPTEAGTDPLLQARRPKRAPWATSRSKTEVQELFETRDAILQLHGLIPRSAGINGGAVLAPVVSELDYIATHDYTHAALQALLRESPALFVGTSLTDQPLLQALSGTVDSGHSRYALVPIGFNLEQDRERHRALRASQLERYQHFGVSPIYVDYYFQIAQFLEELVIGVRSAAKVRLEDSPSPESEKKLRDDSPRESTNLARTTQSVPTGSYGSRLLRWAADWTQQDSIETNDISVSLTDFAQVLVRSQLDLSESEVTKLELWVRDVPQTHRDLRLWQSTVTVHLQEESARRAELSNHSEVVAVKAFVAGRPIISTLRDDEFLNQRWRTYIAAPIRLADPRDMYGRLPVGALVFASMRPSSKSGLIKLRRRASMAKVMESLLWLGELLTETDPATWKALSVEEGEIE